jgi:hypothetical protein
MNSAVLLTQSLPGQNIADLLTAKLKEAIQQFGFEGRVIGWVYDNRPRVS